MAVAAAAARAAIEDVVGPQRADLLLTKPAGEEAQDLDLAPTALVLYNLSSLRRVGQVTVEEAARVKKFVLSSRYFESLKAAGAIGKRNGGGGRNGGRGSSRQRDQRRDKELARLREEGDANRLVRKRFLTASLELVEEWEAEQARFLNAALQTVKFAIRRPTEALGLSSSAVEARARLVRQLNECVGSSVQLTRSLDMKSHPLVAGKVVPGASVLGARGAAFKRFGGLPVWALLDPPHMHFYHMKDWDESLAAWNHSGGPGGADGDSNDSILGGGQDVSMMSTSMSMTATMGGGGGGDGGGGGGHKAGRAHTIALDQVESCAISATNPDRLDLVLSQDNDSGGKGELKLEFRAVGSGSSTSSIVLGAAAAGKVGAEGGGDGAGGGGSKHAAAAAAAAAWKHHIDAHLGYARVIRPLIEDAQLFMGAENVNDYYRVLQTLGWRAGGGRRGLDIIIPLAFVRRMTAVPETLRVSRVDASPQVATLQRAVRQGQAPHPMAHTNMDQVRKDVPRDTLRINGRTYSNMRGDAVVEVLANEILSYVRRSPALRGLGGSFSHSSSSASFSAAADDDAPSASRQLPVKHAEATALVFARRVLLGSTRTVSGGDAYDAVEWFFGNQKSSVMICLDPSRTDAVSISFYDAPVRRERGGSDSGDSDDSDGGGGSGSSLASRLKKQGLPAADDFSMYPVAQVRTKNYFKLCCMEEDLDRSQHPSAGAAGPGGTVTLAWVTAEFERSFSLVDKNGGTVSLVAELL